MSIPHFRAFATLSLLLLGSVAYAPAQADASKPAAAQQSYEFYSIGDVRAPTPGKVQPGLLLMGGGDWAVDAFRWMAGKAGNGHIVILRASGAAEAQDEFFKDVGGILSAQTFVFHDRASASDPRMLEILRKADGIFIAGGDQSNYVNFWKGTPVNEVLNQHVRDGKPLGGTSAGLAIMGAYSYGAMDGGSLTSEEALKDPMGPAVTIVDDFLQLAPLPAHQVITDTHFGKRERLGRLITFVARIAKEQSNPGIKGIGVDENTALCIDGDGVGKVFTGSGGSAWLVVPQALLDAQAKGDKQGFREFMDGRLEPGQPLDFPGITVTGIGAASDFSLPGFTVRNPSFQLAADVIRGRLVVRPLE